MIYVLKLADNNYYVGRTNDFENCLKQHIEGSGSEWTKIYRFIDIYETHNSNDSFLEDMIVKKMMYRFGIDRVRGGSYSEVHLSLDKIRLIRNEIRAAKCFICANEHLAKDCPSKKPTIIQVDKEIPEQCSECNGYHFTKKCIASSNDSNTMTYIMNKMIIVLRNYFT